MRPCSSVRKADLSLGKCFQQGRPDGQTQTVARVAWVGIAVVLDMAEAMLPDIGFNSGTRLIQPGPDPAQAFAPLPDRHASKPGHAGPTQRLQQQGFCLVTLMLSQQEQISTCCLRHLAQRGIANIPCPSFDALPDCRPLNHGSILQPQRQTCSSPVSALLLAMQDPGIGLAAQTVMNMQRQHLQSGALPIQSCGLQSGGVQQRSGIKAATVGDGNAAGRLISASWCRRIGHKPADAHSAGRAIPWA